jgi:hypothetical protein
VWLICPNPLTDTARALAIKATEFHCTKIGAEQTGRGGERERERERQDHEEDDNEGEERNARSVCDNASQGTNRDYESSGISFKMSKLFRRAKV